MWREWMVPNQAMSQMFNVGRFGVRTTSFTDSIGGACCIRTWRLVVFRTSYIIEHTWFLFNRRLPSFVNWWDNVDALSHVLVCPPNGCASSSLWTLLAKGLPAGPLTHRCISIFQVPLERLGNIEQGHHVAKKEGAEYLVGVDMSRSPTFNLNFHHSSTGPSPTLQYLHWYRPLVWIFVWAFGVPLQSIMSTNHCLSLVNSYDKPWPLGEICVHSLKHSLIWLTEFCSSKRQVSEVFWTTQNTLSPRLDKKICGRNCKYGNIVLPHSSSRGHVGMGVSFTEPWR